MPKHAIQQLGMDAFERFLFLRTMPGMDQLPPEVARVIAAHTHERYSPAGSYLYREGEPAIHVQYVVRGSVEIRRNEEAIRTMGPRTVVGGVSALAGDQQGYDGVALEDTVTLQIATDDVQEIFEDHFALLRSVLQGTSREVIAALKQLGPGAGFAPIGPPMTCPDRTFDLVEKMAFLRKTIAFRDAQIDAIAELASDVSEVRLQQGEHLWEIGDQSGHFLLPLCGTVECHAQNPEQHFVLGPGDTVGCMDALAGEPRWFRARVGSRLVALRVDVDVLYDVLEDNFRMAMSLLRGMAVGMLRLYDLKGGVSPDQSMPSANISSDRG
ncbi:MAG: cyclic nucleotide-binding domain-containing protein [Myxococcales bacterium]|nr:cyclic nucleotide-binding domain-containing protein [Myxococcales bacterium]MDH3846131.1 cyclic nucleotide-binding domain-containing protein [Myxococcales bacterium]